MVRRFRSGAPPGIRPRHVCGPGLLTVSVIGLLVCFFGGAVRPNGQRQLSVRPHNSP